MHKDWDLGCTESTVPNMRKEFWGTDSSLTSACDASFKMYVLILPKEVGNKAGGGALIAEKARCLGGG